MKKWKLAFTAILVIGLAAGPGCLNSTSGTEEPPSTLSVNLEPEQTTSGYRVSGDVDVEILGADDPFEGVMLCAYGESGQLLASENLGTLEPVDNTRVNVTMRDRPVYILVDHPRFRNHDLGFRYISWSGTHYVNQGGVPERDIDAFEYTPPTAAGTCGTMG